MGVFESCGEAAHELRANALTADFADFTDSESKYPCNPVIRGDSVAATLRWVIRGRKEFSFSLKDFRFSPVKGKAPKGPNSEIDNDSG